jgi:carbonic anhydrase
MKKIMAIGLLLISNAAFSSDGKHWSYSGETGPDNWAKLSPEFSACMGSNQSPINLAGFIDAKLAPIKFKYADTGLEIVNNGHTIQINSGVGSSISIDSIQFDLKQFHFHAPSENLIKGKSFPLEAHLVHSDKDGNLAVVAVMFKEGKANKVLAQAWTQMPQNADEKNLLSANLAPLGLLPSNRNYYRFNGSLTTPPCSEGVRWLVMKNAVTASKEQIDAFTHVIHHPNNRPVQPVKARPVLE